MAQLLRELEQCAQKSGPDSPECRELRRKINEQMSIRRPSHQGDLANPRRDSPDLPGYPFSRQPESGDEP